MIYFNIKQIFSKKINMKLLDFTKSKMVAGGYNNNNHNYNNNQYNNAVDAIAKATIIDQGLATGESWAQIGKNIGHYFQKKYNN